MSANYEFLLQPMTPGVAYDPEPVEKAIVVKGATLQPDGAHRLRFKHGDVEFRRLKEGGQVIATEVKVPISDKHDLVRESFIATYNLAQELGVKVVDPQLSRSVVLNDEAAIADKFMELADFAGRYSGVSAAVPANFTPTEGLLGPGAKVAIIVAAVVFIIYILSLA